MKQVKYIELVLENCEAIKVERKHIGFFTLSNIKRSISRMALNSISEVFEADEFFIQLSPSMNQLSSFVSTSEDNKTRPFDRLSKHHDVTALAITYDDNSSEYIYVNWFQEAEYNNPFQSTAFNAYNGDFFIAVCETKTAESFFSSALKDRKTEHWDLYKKIDELNDSHDEAR